MVVIVASRQWDSRVHMDRAGIELFTQVRLQGRDGAEHIYSRVGRIPGYVKIVQVGTLTCHNLAHSHTVTDRELEAIKKNVKML